MKRLRPSLASLAMAALVLAWLALPSFAQSKSVFAYDSSFSPTYVEIDPGDSVTWTNVGETVHNLIGNSSNWPSSERLLVPGASTTIEFAIPGSYSYTCEYHPSTMWGSVQVSSEPGPTPTTTSPGPSPSVSASPSPSPSASASPTASPSEEPVVPVETTTPPPTDPPSPFPTELPSFGEEQTGGGSQANPELASGGGTPPPDSAAKPPLTILGALAVILLFAGNPLIKPRPVPQRVNRRGSA